MTISDFCGRANCGCVYHAEEGIPCEHDLKMLSYDEFRSYLLFLLCAGIGPAPMSEEVVDEKQALVDFTTLIRFLILDGRISVENARNFWKHPH